MSDMTLSIDIGSTRTHIAAVDTYMLECFDRIDFDNGEFDEAFVANVRKTAGAYPQIRRANITSCIRSLAIKAEELCAGLRINPSAGNGAKRFDAVEFTLPHTRLPVSFDYEEPGTLGMDRICDALACSALFKGKNCVIIDVGTAVTVDYLRGGEAFLGMAILTGYDMQLDALHKKTDSLPRIDFGSFRNDAAVSLPSKSTEDCIKAGILYGTAGAIDRCIGVCRRTFGKAITVATGGGWEPIKPFIKHKTITIPDLTLIGAGIYR